MELVTVPCGLCGAEAFKPFKKLNGYSIVRCSSCDFASVNPRPTEADILNAYTDDSSARGLSFASAYTSDQPVESYTSWTGRWVLQRFLRSTEKGTFLDIGAGQGWAVLEAGRLGADAYGFEFGESRAFRNDTRLNGRIFKDEAALRHSAKTFDRLYLSAVLEHVYHPVDFLKQWMQLLKPGGRFCVAAVPNMESIFIRTGLDGWDGNIPPHHLNYFTPKTLRDCVRRAGGKVEELYTMGAPVRIHPRNLFRQKEFEGKHWGDRAEQWGFDSGTPTTAAARADTWTVAAANHALKWSGMGANLYTVFSV
jgi:SAM-dependent methyltransferase